MKALIHIFCQEGFDSWPFTFPLGGGFLKVEGTEEQSVDSVLSQI